MKTSSRSYTQRARAEAAEEKTGRIREAALALFVELPWDQITLAAVAERAQVGLQTVLRRAGSKDGLATMVSEWIGPQVAALLGPPDTSDPQAVARAFARHYEVWALVTERTYQQQDVSPALAAMAEGGRRAHREWIVAAFGDVLTTQSPQRRRELRARLVAVTGVELWLVLRRDEGLSQARATAALRDLLAATLAAFPSTTTEQS